MLGLIGMSVEADRRLDVGVPELLLDEVDRFARSQPERRRRMAKVVEAYARQVCPLERWYVPALAYVAHAERRAGGRREHENTAAASRDESVPMFAEDRDHSGVDCYEPGAVPLRCSDSAAPERTFDTERLVSHVMSRHSGRALGRFVAHRR
jgi:hypothetical protein